ncbi:patatin-like phospholipase domain-containing protein 4 isoform X5 [Mustela nigripes]|uniref:patatin-like phospholipase domain-containing protein 4 isoform X5 n=1 Tax=Mustela nigripes TaxID=77151 RepID=UPI0028166F34|nr:patatin-like phospholipase domain-containing protein 4 isoform X5 [Mustela nigripes]
MNTRKHIKCGLVEGAHILGAASRQQPCVHSRPETTTSQTQIRLLLPLPSPATHRALFGLRTGSRLLGLPPGSPCDLVLQWLTDFQASGPCRLVLPAAPASLPLLPHLQSRSSSMECNEFTYEFAEETRRQSFGAVTPGYDFMARLRSGMERILPSNAHELAHSRLHVSITNTKTRENYLVSSFRSREDLIKVLLASSFVPIYAGLKPVEYRGQVTVARNR